MSPSIDHNGNSRKLNIGDVVEPFTVQTLQHGEIRLPHPELVTHLQFRRFAGCRICNLHLRSFTQRHAELQRAGIFEVVVFHSPREELQQYQAQAPFATVPDHERRLYRRFGVEKSLWSVLNPRTWLSGLRGILKFGVHFPGQQQTPLGLPADFLIASSGQVLECKYGTHADDHWPLDWVLERVKMLS